MEDVEQGLRDELRDLAAKRARCEAKRDALDEECDLLDAQMNEKLMALAEAIVRRAEPSASTGKKKEGRLPDQAREVRGHARGALLLIYSEPEKHWTCRELFAHDLGYSSENSLNGTLSGLVDKGLLIKTKKERVGFKANPKLVRGMR